MADQTEEYIFLMSHIPEKLQLFYDAMAVSCRKVAEVIAKVWRRGRV